MNPWEYKASVQKISDGDTIHFLVDLGFGSYRKLKVRLAYVDTPEIYFVSHLSEEYKLGKKASQFTSDWLKEHEDEDGNLMIRTYQDTGKYGRYLAEVFPGNGEGKSLNEALLESGNATLYEG